MTIKEYIEQGKQESAYWKSTGKSTGQIFGEQTKKKTSWFKKAWNAAIGKKEATPKDFGSEEAYNDATQILDVGDFISQMAIMKRFHLGNEYGSQSYNDVFFNGFEDPTHLTFKIEFGEFGASITDNATIAALQKNSLTSNVFFMDYDNMPMGLLDLNYSEIIGTGKNAKTDNVFNEQQTYNAVNYLINRNEDRRAQYLRDFIDGLYTIQRDFPYLFQKITGISKLFEIDVTRGQRLKDVNLQLTCMPDGVDQKIHTLVELYRKAAWDDQYQRWILPDIMRYFKMVIYVFDNRSLQMGNGEFSPDQDLFPIFAFECAPCEFVLKSIFDNEYTQDYTSLKTGEPVIDIKVKNVKTYMSNNLFQRVKYIKDIITKSDHYAVDDSEATFSFGQNIDWRFRWLQRMFLLPDEYNAFYNYNGQDSSVSTGITHYVGDRGDYQGFPLRYADIIQPEDTWHRATVSDHGYVIRSAKQLWKTLGNIITQNTVLVRDSRTADRYYFVNDLTRLDPDTFVYYCNQNFVELDVKGMRRDVEAKIRNLTRVLKGFKYPMDISTMSKIKDPSLVIDLTKPKQNLTDLDIDVRHTPMTLDVSLDGAEIPTQQFVSIDENLEKPEQDLTRIIRDLSKPEQDFTQIDKNLEKAEQQMNPILLNLELPDQDLTNLILNLDMAEQTLVQFEQNLDKPRQNMTKMIPDLTKALQNMVNLYLNLDKQSQNMIEIIPNLDKQEQNLAEIILNIDKAKQNLTELELNLVKPEENFVEIEQDLTKTTQNFAQLILNLRKPLHDYIELIIDDSKPEQNLQELLLNLEKSEQNLTELILNLDKQKQNMVEIEPNLNKANMNMSKIVQNLDRQKQNMVEMEPDLSKAEHNYVGLDVDLTKGEMNMSEIDVNLDRQKQNMVEMMPDLSKAEHNYVSIEGDLSKADMNMTEIVQNLDKNSQNMTEIEQDLTKSHMNMVRGDINLDKPEMNMSELELNVDKHQHNMIGEDVELRKPQHNLVDADVDLSKSKMNMTEIEGDVEHEHMNMSEIEQNLDKIDMNMQKLTLDIEKPEMKMDEINQNLDKGDMKMTEQIRDERHIDMKMIDGEVNDEHTVMNMVNDVRDESHQKMEMIQGVQDTHHQTQEMTEMQVDVRKSEMDRNSMTGIDSGAEYKSEMNGVQLIESDDPDEMKMSQILDNNEKSEMKMTEMLINDELSEMKMSELKSEDVDIEMKMSQLVEGESVGDMKMSELEQNLELGDMKMSEISESESLGEMKMTQISDNGENVGDMKMSHIAETEKSVIDKASLSQIETGGEYKSEISSVEITGGESGEMKMTEIQDEKVVESESQRIERVKKTLSSGAIMNDTRDRVSTMLMSKIETLSNLDLDSLQSASMEQLTKLVQIMEDTVNDARKQMKMTEIKEVNSKTGNVMKMPTIIQPERNQFIGKPMMAVDDAAMQRAESGVGRFKERNSWSKNHKD